MDESKKKAVMITAIVACLVLAVAITFRNSGKSGGIGTLDSGEMWWVKCSNPDCGTSYTMDKKEYLETLQERSKEKGAGGSAIALVCQECGEESIYQAVKCKKCGNIFFAGAVRRDFTDRCPECGYSTMEESRKAP